MAIMFVGYIPEIISDKTIKHPHDREHLGVIL